MPAWVTSQSLLRGLSYAIVAIVACLIGVHYQKAKAEGAVEAAAIVDAAQGIAKLRTPSDITDGFAKGDVIQNLLKTQSVDPGDPWFDRLHVDRKPGVAILVDHNVSKVTCERALHYFNHGYFPAASMARFQVDAIVIRPDVTSKEIATTFDKAMASCHEGTDIKVTLIGSPIAAYNNL